MKNKKLLWRCCVAAVVAIILITLSPLVTKAGKTVPTLSGLPYTLWLSILLTFLLVVLTYIGSKVIPEDKEEEE